MKPLWNGSGCYIPREVATCPECDSELTARSMEWEADTGRPVATAIEIQCLDVMLAHEDRLHHWWQSHWQPVRDKIAAWCGARVDYPNR